MKALLSFNLPEETEDHNDALNGTKYRGQLEEIWETLFRPRHKYGYDNPVLDKFVNTKTGQLVMDELEALYRKARE